MANIKFSQFTVGPDYAAITDLVGYSGGNNIRITPDNLISTWNSDQQTVRFSNTLSGGSASVFGIGAVSNSSTTLTLDTGATANYQINGLNAVSFDGTIWTIGSTVGAFQGNLQMGNIGGIPRNQFTNGKLWVGDGTNIGSELKLNNDPSLGVSRINFSGSDMLLFNPTPGVNRFDIGVNQDIQLNYNTNIISTFTDVVHEESVNFQNDVKDITSSTGSANFILKSNGGGGAGVSWKQEQPGCQIKIVGTAGLTNTNNNTDFLVPYNTVIVNDDATIFNPIVTGGFGNQGAIQVLQSGRYEFFARYSSFDLIQPSLPTVDGTKFFRITAATDVAAPGIGTKQCILQDLIVATSTNGEANVTGGGFMDLNAGDYFKIVGFHTGATGGSGTQGFPVNSNAFFNEPMLWLVKIQ